MLRRNPVILGVFTSIVMFCGEVTSPYDDPPEAPEEVSATANADTTITIFWEKIWNADEYDVSRKDTESGHFEQLGTTTKFSFIDSNLIPGTMCWYRVKGRNDNGESGWSPICSAKVAGNGPSQEGPRITIQPSSRTVSFGDTVSVFVQASGEDLKYQWQKNNEDLAGETNSSIIFAPVTAEDTGATFRCIVGNANGTDTSNAAYLKVDIPIAPQIALQPEDVEAVSGDTVSIKIATAGTHPLTYQWQQNGADVEDETDSIIVFSPLTEAQNGNAYRCIVSNSLGADTSRSALVTVYQNLKAPEITAEPQPVVVEEGLSALFAVDAEGVNTEYQWQLNGTDLAEARKKEYRIQPTELSDSGNIYRCIVCNDAGADTSEPVLLSVTKIRIPAKISAQPQDVHVTEGAQAEFSLTAEGSSLSYEWYRDGNFLPGADRLVLVIDNASKADSGTSFFCIVSNELRRDTSTTVTLNVTTEIAPPQIDKAPSSREVTEGEPVTFAVAANGTDLEYMWQRNEQTIANAVLSSYFIESASSADSGGRFRCIVSNEAGTDTSETAILSVRKKVNAPLITSHPQSQSIVEGTPVTFSVNATGTEPEYIWQKNGNDMVGAESPAYTLNSPDLSDDGDVYRCIVLNSAGVDTSEEATLTVNQQIIVPSITKHPKNQSVTEGDKAEFTITADGTDLKFRWEKNGTGIGGTTGPKLVLSSASLNDNGAEIYCIVRNSVGKDTSETALLQVNERIVKPTITTHPQDVSIVEGQSATFSITADGKYLEYKWKKDGEVIEGANQNTYTLPNASLSENDSRLVCVVSNSAGSVPSRSASLTVTEAIVPPGISTHPLSKTVTEGEDVSFVVGATGSDLTYQWNKNGTPLDGQSASTLSFKNITTDDAGEYSCVVSNSAKSITSNSAKLTVTFEPPVITMDPEDYSAPVGHSVTFSVAADGKGLSYQWQKDGQNITNKTEDTYTFTVDDELLDGAGYACLVSNSGGQVLSREAYLNVPIQLARWSFENLENDGKRIPDESGNNNYAQSEIKLKLVNGSIGKALDCSPSDFVLKVPNSVGKLDPDSISIAAWVKPNSFPATGVDRIFNFARYPSGISQGLSLQIWSDGRTLFSLGRDDGYGHWISAFSESILELDEWSFVACTFEGTTMKLYINGELDNSLEYEGGYEKSEQSATIGMGVQGELAHHWFDGSLDELRVYKKALTSEALREIYQREKP